MATFMLVHGAWHGGWCWKKVSALLRSGGHAVHTPTLTGLGERAHLVSPDITLSTHVEDIAAVFEFEDLRDVILVGHSYGGIIITGVADRVPERISSLVYLDAYVGEQGKSWLDMRGSALPTDDPLSMPWPSPQWFGVTEPEDVQWVEPRLTRHPTNSATTPLELANQDISSQFPRIYIRCLGYDFPPFDAVADRCRRDPAWRYHEMKTGHDAMVTAPNELTSLILQASGLG
jgi:pimeloyl-ACP methyl ester carboxylesterase